ncbi:MAG: hypothetical protein FJ299_07465 [Planctomycetes bacterium]|nr:hypothetical protein [Planctomycetota bacterium]
MSIFPRGFALAAALVAWSAGPVQVPVPGAQFEPQAHSCCKPSAPIELALGRARPLAGGRVELAYEVTARIDCELLTPRVEVGPGWQLVAHEGPAEGSIARGEARSGSLELQPLAGVEPGLELVARFALPDPERAGESIEQQRVFAFGARLPAVLTGTRAVRSGSVVSNDVPSFTR